MPEELCQVCCKSHYVSLTQHSDPSPLTVHITNLTVQQHTTHWRSRDTIVTMHTNAQWAQCTAAHILRDKYKPCPHLSKTPRSSHPGFHPHCILQYFIICCRLQFLQQNSTSGADPNILDSQAFSSRISPKFKSALLIVIQNSVRSHLMQNRNSRYQSYSFDGEGGKYWQEHKCGGN